MRISVTQVRVLLVLVTLVALFSRRPDAYLNPQFWAEDGVVFYSQVMTLGAKSFLVRYGGYFHLYSRVFAWLFSGFAPAVMPTLYLLASVVGVLFTALLCTSSRVQLPVALRFAMGFAVTLAPSPNEVFHTLLNTFWVLALCFILVLLFEAPKNRRQWAFDIGLLTVLGLSGPLVVAFSPLFVLRALHRRDRHGWVMLSVVAILCAVQLSPAGLTRDNGHFGTVQALDALRSLNGYVGRTFAGNWGRPGPEELSFAIPLFVAGLLLHVALLLDAWKRKTMVPVYFLGGGALVLLSAMWAWRGCPGMLKLLGERYFDIPITLLVWTLLAAWSSMRRPMFLALPLVVIAFITSHRSPAMSDYKWKEASRCLSIPGPCLVRIPPNWKLRKEW